MHWYAVRVTYSRELFFKDYLDAEGIENYIPMRYEYVVRKERRLRKLVPAVHNLVFVRSTRERMDEIKNEPGMNIPIRYIMDRETRQPIVIPDSQMRSFIDMGALGYYDKSYRLMMLPLQNVTSVINPVIQPVLSSLQDDKSELAKKYNKIIQCIAAISFPLAVFLFFAAYEIINIVYGDNWNPAVPVFKILTISLPLQMILSSSGAIFQTANSTDLMFFTGIRNTFVTLSGFLIAICVFNTIEAVAWSWDISLAINFILTYHTMYRKVFHIRIWSMIRKLSIPLYSALLLCFFLSVQQATFSIDNIYLSLLVKCLVAFGSMALSMRFIMHTNFSRLLYFIKS